MLQNSTMHKPKCLTVLPSIHRTEFRSKLFEKRFDIEKRICYSLTSRSLSQCNDQSIQIPYKIHSGFTSNEKKMIKEALEIVSKRLFNHRIIENMYEHSEKKGFYFGLDVWQRSNLSKHSTNHGAHYLLEYQLTSLKNKYENGEFPLVNIRPIYEENNISGRGFLNTIECVSHSCQSLINGHFEIYLNRYQLEMSSMSKSDVISWSGVIVHEMLHNLGHNHQIGDYSNRWQINLFSRCFEHNGKYYV